MDIIAACLTMRFKDIILALDMRNDSPYMLADFSFDLIQAYTEGPEFLDCEGPEDFIRGALLSVDQYREVPLKDMAKDAAKKTLSEKQDALLANGRSEVAIAESAGPKGYLKRAKGAMFKGFNKVGSQRKQGARPMNRVAVLCQHVHTLSAVPVHLSAPSLRTCDCD